MRSYRDTPDAGIDLPIVNLRISSGDDAATTKVPRNGSRSFGSGGCGRHYLGNSRTTATNHNQRRTARPGSRFGLATIYAPKEQAEFVKLAGTLCACWL